MSDSLNQNPEEECWLTVVGYEGIYEISNLGRVAALGYDRRFSRPGILRPNMGRGYYGILLSFKRGESGKRKRFTIHRLVMEAFVGPRPQNHDINHINGNKLDNRLCNLEYVTKSENQKHSFRLGLQDNRGEKHSQARLDDEKVRHIRSLISEGVRLTEIAAMFGVSQGQISHIKSGACWSHVT